MKKIYLLEDLDCAHCAEKIEKEVAKLEGVTESKVTFLTQKLSVEVEEEKAAELFAKEIEMRAGYTPFECGEPCVELVSDETVENKDSFFISQSDSRIVITAKGIRGLIYGYSYFLRKCTFNDGKITLIRNISGEYSPQMKIRGHQCGYGGGPPHSRSGNRRGRTLRRSV